MRPFAIRRAIPRDADLIKCRSEDSDEWEASVLGGLDHLKKSIEMSAECLTIHRGLDRPHLIVGVVKSPHGGADITWMVMSENAAEHGLTIMRDFKPDMDGFFERWPNTQCVSYESNIVHHRWLRYIGYVEKGTIKSGPYDLNFKHFVKVESPKNV